MKNLVKYSIFFMVAILLFSNCSNCGPTEPHELTSGVSWSSINLSAYNSYSVQVTFTNDNEYKIYNVYAVVKTGSVRREYIIANVMESDEEFMSIYNDGQWRPEIVDVIYSETR